MPSREIYFNEFNILMENAAYLPIVSGILQSYASKFTKVTDNYRFMPFIFYRHHQDEVLAQYNNPSVAAFSASMWNEQLNLKVAELVKRKFPDCLIVFGGPQVPYDAEDYFARHPFIDIGVRGEGEEAFAEILERFLESRDFSGIAGISYRNTKTGGCIKNEAVRAQKDDLDLYPSPYLDGLYEDLMAKHSDLHFQAIIETNRGCPFPCTFCYWGMGGLSRKYRFFSLDRTRQILDWCGRHKIQYVFNADSNFGMIKHDYEIAEMIVATKLKYGYPEKFRTCFGKNSDDKIYAIAKLLHEHDLEKGITLARQSNDEETLKIIRRENIKLSMYRNLQFKFNKEDVPVYSELILGLPGETVDSWKRGIEELLQCGVKNQLFVYHCQVYPNTEMGEPEYQKKYGMELRRIPLTEIHGRIHNDGIVSEYEDIAISSNSMSREQWRSMATLSWTLQLMHGMKLAYYVMVYIAGRYGVKFTDFLEFLSSVKFDRKRCPIMSREMGVFAAQAVSIQAGGGRGRIMKEYGEIYWDEEEASFLRIVAEKDAFYAELLGLVAQFLTESGAAFDRVELEEAILYQKVRVPDLTGKTPPIYEFQFNFPEYFNCIFLEAPIALERKPQKMTIVNAKTYADKRAFAQETILRGRKSGTTLLKVSWLDAAQPETAGSGPRR